LGNEVARAKLHYAEIALASSNELKAQERLESAIKAWEGREMDAGMRLRLGRDALLLAMIKQRADHEGLEQDFQRARKALNEVPMEGVDVDQLRQWQAILNFHEAKWLSEKGDEAKALEQLKRATKTLNQLADSRPEAAVLRSELASCYLSSATILEGLGKLTEAGEVRQSAAEELVEMLKKDPNNVELMLDLAGCYGAVAESALMSGEIATTSKYSSAAMVMLDRVLKLAPESREANTRKGAQLGIQAGLLRDQGNSTEAMKAFEDGIAILQRQAKYPMRDYRLALLIWQKGRMLGFSGKKDDEIKLLIEANESLKNLKLTSDEESPRQENLHRSRAYLLGDLAHSLEMSKQVDQSKAIYQEAIGVWQALLKLRPNSEEYRSALEWNRQRVSDL
jgi:tetratricopeptide (TPR) repeat protein